MLITNEGQDLLISNCFEVTTVQINYILRLNTKLKKGVTFFLK